MTKFIVVTDSDIFIPHLFDSYKEASDWVSYVECEIDIYKKHLIKFLKDHDVVWDYVFAHPVTNSDIDHLVDTKENWPECMDLTCLPYETYLKTGGMSKETAPKFIAEYYGLEFKYADPYLMRLDSMMKSIKMTIRIVEEYKCQSH